MPDGQRRRLVIDANILIRAALGRRVKETLVSHAEPVDFFAPDIAFDDAEEHLPAVLTKFDRVAQIDPALAFLNQLRSIVAAVPEEAFRDIKDEALARIQRDPDDWPVLAVAMLLDCPIWTEDNDFFGTGVPPGPPTASTSISPRPPDRSPSRYPRPDSAASSSASCLSAASRPKPSRLSSARPRLL